MDRLHLKKLFFIILPVIASVIMTSCSPSQNTRRNGGMFSGSGQDIVRTARQYLGVPYKSGGVNPSGFDCSGYVMYVYEKNGISIPRATAEQYRNGQPVSLRTAGPGDLLFFRTSGPDISHVAIYAGKGRFIHAPSSGKTISYASLDNPYWNRRYAGAVTYLERRSIRTGGEPGRRQWVH